MPPGHSALYSSYLGGEVEDVGYGIAVDNNANAYVTGLTYSATNFPVTPGALQSTYGGSGDAFVAKVNTVGSGAASLVFSTYLGGAGLDQGNAIALDSAGNAYVAGLTNSAAFGFHSGRHFSNDLRRPRRCVRNQVDHRRRAHLLHVFGRHSCGLGHGNRRGFHATMCT